MKLELNVQHFLKSTIQLYRTDIKIEEMQGHLVTTNVKAGILNSMVHSWVCTDYRFTTRAHCSNTCAQYVTITAHKKED